MIRFFALLFVIGLCAQNAQAYSFNFDTKTLSTDFMDIKSSYADIQKLNIPRKDKWSYRYYGCSVTSVLWPDSPNQITIYWNLPKLAQYCDKQVENKDASVFDTLPLTIPADAKIESLEWRSELVPCDSPDDCKAPNLSDNWRIDGLRIGDSLKNIAEKYGSDLTFGPFASEGGGVCCEGKAFPKAFAIELIDNDKLDKRYIYIDDLDTYLRPETESLEYKKMPKDVQEGLGIFGFTLYSPTTTNE